MLANIEYGDYQLENTKLHFIQTDGAYELKLDTIFMKAPLEAEFKGQVLAAHIDRSPSRPQR